MKKGSLNQVRPEPCVTCVWCCPWNGQGWGCAHKSVKKLLKGISIRDISEITGASSATICKVKKVMVNRKMLEVLEKQILLVSTEYSLATMVADT